MEKMIQEKLESVGVDIPIAVERLVNNETLLLQFLKKFPQDSSYQLFQEAMRQKDFEEAANAIHNLKGLCGNLSIMPLYEAVCAELDLLRKGDYETAMEYVPEIEERYGKTLDILNSL